jgi:hypothetical protein
MRPSLVEVQAQRDASNARTVLQAVFEYSLVMRRVDWTCLVVTLDNLPASAV